MSCDDISIDQFLLLFLFAQHAITRVSSKVSLCFIMIDQINELPEDGLKSLPKTWRKYMV